MLSRIYVDGFKSLKDFKLSFNQGLNVLIGPNGAGKSNICQSLALLGAAANNELIEYILYLGGAKNIFKIGDDANSEDTSRSFTISCRGKVKAADGLKKGFAVLFYSYEIKVGIGEKLEIKGESLRISREVEDKKRKVIIHLKRNEKGLASAKITNNDIAGPINSLIEDRHGEKNKAFKIDLNQSHTDSFLELFGAFYYFVDSVASDLKKLRVLNIDPHVAKKPSDILEPLRMLSDGKRLSNAIYELHKRNDPDLNELNAFMANIMPRYESIHPELSGDKLSRSFSITDVDGNIFPAQSLSDGTVKTIAFMVGMLECNTGSTVIEEPENYLHPWACNSLVQYIRNTFTGRSVILTTHSETMLNAIRPAEIIVCTNADGYTKAERIPRRKTLEQAIEKSGFGCGYHYISGSLGGIPL